MDSIRDTPSRRYGVASADPVSDLKPSEIVALKAVLETQRDTLRAAARGRHHALSEARPELGDEMDDAARNLDESLILRLGDNQQGLLSEVEHALAKLERGEFGVCEGSGEPIGAARLTAQPWARYSIAHQEQLEREQRAAGTK